MANVDKVEKMKAVAVGGPIAGAEYEQAQKALIDTRQRALSDAAARAGSLGAPQAFLNSQAGDIAAPLDGQVQALGTLGQAAGAYGGAMNSAQGQYMNQLGASRGLIEQRMRQQMEDPYEGEYGSIYSKLSSQKKAQQDDAEKRADAVEKRAAEESKARKEFSRQDAAANADLGGDTYDAIADVLKNADDLDTALRYIEGFTTDDAGNYVDSKGNALDINPDALLAYVMKALDPEAFAQNLIKNPQVFAPYAK